MGQKLDVVSGRVITVLQYDVSISKSPLNCIVKPILKIVSPIAGYYSSQTEVDKTIFFAYSLSTDSFTTTITTPSSCSVCSVTD